MVGKFYGDPLSRVTSSEFSQSGIATREARSNDCLNVTVLVFYYLSRAICPNKTSVTDLDDMLRC